MERTVIIVGGSHAGFALAAGLRKRDQQVQITIIGEEPELPYQRPPLSKKYLLGELSEQRLLLRPRSWYAEQNIEVICNTRIVRIARDEHYVEAEDGRRWCYGYLGLTTGCRARELPGDAHEGATNVLSVRHRSDIARLRPLLDRGRRMVIIGGGYIGLETAAAARKLGLAVTLIEAAPRILGRVAAPETAAYFRALHQQNGVRIIEGVGIDGFRQHQGAVTQVVLNNGELLDSDVVIVGIGVIANTALAEQCGLAVDQGICVDDYGRTTDASIFAAGDCTRFPYAGQHIRLESVQNANDQADTVAANMLGTSINTSINTGTPYRPCPWFWSDQYDVSLQIAGLNMGYDTTFVRPGRKEGAQSVWYYRGQQLLAVDAINDAPCYAAVKKVLEQGGNIPQSVAQNLDTRPKQWL